MENPMHFQVYGVDQIAEDVGTGKSVETWYPEHFYDARTVDDVMTTALAESRELRALKEAKPTDREAWILPPVERRFVCFFNFLGWWHWSIGMHLDVRHPHVFLYVPFGFLCLGWSRSPTIDHPRAFGYDGWGSHV